MTKNLKSFILSFILPVVLFSVNSFAQKQTTQQYIEKYKDIAIKKMKEYKIPASITLAQGVLESGNGNSRLARKANNHFGIKCHKNWNGKKFRLDDDKRRECFRKYKSVEESFSDHSYFLTQRSRYSFLFKLDITDYKGWAYGLKKAGYATNPKYPQLLIKIIEENKLYKFDQTTASSSKPKKKKDEIITYDPNFILPSEEDFEAIEIGGNNRQIFTNNGVKFIFAQKDDTFYEIAQDFEIYTWQVYKYNDLKKSSKIKEGQIIYIQPKKKKGNIKFHVVKEHETIYSISQLYGIKLKQLHKKNKMPEGSKPQVGQKLKLR
jgi:uncharacterized FlgJ-related protein